MNGFVNSYFILLALVGGNDFMFFNNSLLKGPPKRFFYEKDLINYRSCGENYSFKTYFPVYSKTSKMILGNTLGRHINLERRLKGGTEKWK